VSVAGVQLAEQTLLNAAVVVVSAASGSAAAGFVFSALLICRAPLQLFQSVQTSLLPHLAGGGDARRAVRATMAAVGAFATACALGLLAVGPFAMRVLFGDGYRYDRVGLAALAVGMGLHLTAGTLNQAALAAGQAGRAARVWLACAAGFVAWMVAGPLHAVARTEVGYLAATAALAAGLWLLVREGLEHVEPRGAAGG
jgi:O-antigen/teichoic acid export membrane protein